MLESDGITARPLRTDAERVAAIALYRGVFRLGDSAPAITTKLLVALGRHGGSAVGAFGADGRLLGFAYGFTGLESGHVYHHSQAAVVDQAVQGRGVGRLLKRAQAQVARETGVSSMRWAYDPMQSRNAHFNLDVLGARGRRSYRSYYGTSDASGPSDRIIVDWDLSRTTSTTPRPALAPAGAPGWGATVEADGLVWLALPARWDALVREDTARAVAVRAQVVGTLHALVSRGLVMLSCQRVSADTALYRLGKESAA